MLLLLVEASFEEGGVASDCFGLVEDVVEVCLLFLVVDKEAPAAVAAVAVAEESGLGGVGIDCVVRLSGVKRRYRGLCAVR